MNFSPSKEMSIRRGLLVLVAVLTAAVQHTPGFNFSLGSFAPMLLVPFAVSVAMYERSLMGLLFGFISGVLWDFASSGADGMYTLMLSALGFGLGILVTFYLRNRLVTAVVLSLFSCTAVSVAYWLVFILRKGYDDSWKILFGHYLPLAVYSAAFIFAYYYLVGFIIKVTGRTENSKQTYIR